MENVQASLEQIPQLDGRWNGVSEGCLRDKYILGAVVGQGSFGKAILATRIDGETVIIKQIKISELSSKDRQEAFNEVTLLSQFDHMNIVRYHECIIEDGCLNIVMEYASEGELSAVIQDRAAQRKPFTEDNIMFWFVQIVLALWHVHSKNILHRDLKSQNIFVADGNILKLGDFGISRVLNSDTELVKTAIGTPYYLSPEICEDKPYNRKSDVWALGCVLYELCTLKKAFDGQSLPALVVRILRGKYPPVATRYSTQLRCLVDCMLKQNPKDRPSVDAILRMEYVRHHVAKYAQHVVQLNADQDLSLDLEELSPMPIAQGQGTPSLSKSTKPRPQKSASKRAARNAVAATVAAQQEVQDLPKHVASEVHSEQGMDDQPSSFEQQANTAAPMNLDETLPSASPFGKIQQEESSDSAEAVANGGRKLVGSTWLAAQQAAMDEIAAALEQFQHGQAQPKPIQKNAAACKRAAVEPSTPEQCASPTADDNNAKPTGARPTNAAQRGNAGGIKDQKGVPRAVDQKPNAKDKQKKPPAVTKRSPMVSWEEKQRQKERERHLAQIQKQEQAEAAKRARRAAELENQIKEREVERKKQLEQAQQHLQAHKKQMRSVKSRINVAHLRSRFSGRSSTQEEVGTGGDDEYNESGSSSSSTMTSLPGETEPAAALSPVPQQAIQELEARKPVRRMSHDQVTESKCVTSRKTSLPDPSSDPPWKAKNRKAQNAEFPEVEIFCPFGSLPVNGKALGATFHEAGVMLASRGSGTSSEGCSHDEETEDEIQVLWGGRQRKPLLDVLSQIQGVLADELEHSECGKSDSSSKLDLPPESETAEAAPASTVPVADAVKVEQLRMNLEMELGEELFLQAYRQIRMLLEMAGDDADGLGQDAMPDFGLKPHQQRLLNKLVMLEDAVFSN